ncbi:diheme cytochrome c-553 [Afipia sp. GAS231]|uniref:diheme cytochrome c-553 n=1 Tax=Afipia sp. GAS231 TaxID=1882747 RepID=UPI0018D2F78D|nr:diheme cytochrome c-553 [Afipia sp. GAS231]
MKARLMIRNARLNATVSAAAAVIWVSLCISADAQQGAGEQMIKRGEYLVHVIGCEGCHTPYREVVDGPPEIDMSRYLSGHPSELKTPALVPTPPWVIASSTYHTAHAGPWGVSFAANLTPDNETGLGKWTEEEFIQTLREGKHQGRGRALLPPMPWTHFRMFSGDDLKSIFAFLRTVKPIKNKVPEPLGSTNR